MIIADGQDLITGTEEEAQRGKIKRSFTRQPFLSEGPVAVVDHRLHKVHSGFRIFWRGVAASAEIQYGIGATASLKQERRHQRVGTVREREWLTRRIHQRIDRLHR